MIKNRAIQVERLRKEGWDKYVCESKDTCEGKELKIEDFYRYPSGTVWNVCIKCHMFRVKRNKYKSKQLKTVPQETIELVQELQRLYGLEIIDILRELESRYLEIKDFANHKGKNPIELLHGLIIKLVLS